MTNGANSFRGAVKSLTYDGAEEGEGEEEAEEEEEEEEKEEGEG